MATQVYLVIISLMPVICFFTNLALLFSSIVIHAKVPDSYLLSTVLPIPKGNNVNKSDS